MHCMPTRDKMQWGGGAYLVEQTNKLAAAEADDDENDEFRSRVRCTPVASRRSRDLLTKD